MLHLGLLSCYVVVHHIFFIHFLLVMQLYTIVIIYTLCMIPLALQRISLVSLESGKYAVDVEDHEHVKKNHEDVRIIITWLTSTMIMVMTLLNILRRTMTMVRTMMNIFPESLQVRNLKQ